MQKLVSAQTLFNLSQSHNVGSESVSPAGRTLLLFFLKKLVVMNYNQLTLQDGCDVNGENCTCCSTCSGSSGVVIS